MIKASIKYIKLFDNFSKDYKVDIEGETLNNDQLERTEPDNSEQYKNDASDVNNRMKEDIEKSIKTDESK